jgi:ferrous-iron efflux pump FieF
MYSKEKKAILAATSTAIFLMVFKWIAGALTWSMAIFSSAIDSWLDFFISLLNYFAINKAENPEDEKHNYGYWKIEWFWALFEGLIIFISWILIIYFAIIKIIENKIQLQTEKSIFIMVISILLTGILVLYLSKIIKETNSLILKSDLLHYKTDLYTNIGVIISLIILKILNLPIIDPIISIVIAIYLIYGSFKIFKEWFEMLMDVRIDPKHIKFVKNTILDQKEIKDYHFLKTRKSGKNNFIEFHIVFHNTKISLKKAHEVSDKIESTLIAEIPNSTVVIHLDYYDDSKEVKHRKIV